MKLTLLLFQLSFLTTQVSRGGGGLKSPQTPSPSSPSFTRALLKVRQLCNSQPITQETLFHGWKMKKMWMLDLGPKKCSSNSSFCFRTTDFSWKKLLCERRIIYVYQLDLNNIYLVIDDNFVISMGMEVDCLLARGTSIQGEVRHVEIWSVTQNLLSSKYHGFLAILL